MAKFVVLLRIKDGIRFVDEWLQCFEQLADEIVVLDNGSTDGSYERLQASPKVVEIQRTEGYNEGRDKNMLYASARSRNPNWCLWIDIDEIFEPAVTRKVIDRMMSSGLVKKYAFRRFHFTDTTHFAGSWFRLNYSAGHDRIMWKESPSGYFENFIIDSPNVKGIRGLMKPTHYRLKHLGYISRDLVDKKAAIYRAIIPEKESTLQEMYMRGEKRIRWEDKHSSAKVIALNVLLDLLLLKHYVGKAVNRITRRFRRPAPVVQLNNENQVSAS
ncbi:MAG: glycosyltransferase [Chitinophagaceae bacterium]|nr:MAG: glycosyltransferase [Chitinophagaceae bacterium]